MLKRLAAWPQGVRWRVGGIAAVVVALAVAWVLFVPAADWLAHHDVGSAKGPLLQTARDAARGRLLTLAAGLAAAGALVFTALNFNLLRRNSEQADQWQRRTHELTEQRQVTDRYTKAIEQLGSDKLDVRIGGIYALERIAHDSAKDHPTVLEVLTAFIREHSQELWPLPDPDGRERPRRPRPDVLLPPAAQGREQKGWTRPDVQAAATVIGRRDQEHDTPDQPIDLVGADLTGANLRDACLARAKLLGTDLSGARLDGADLSRADLSHADLTNAQMPSALLIDAVLFGACLAGARLSHARLAGASLLVADLSGADLDWADLSRADLSGVNLDRADLVLAKLDNAQLLEALWPQGKRVPEGWERDAASGLLRRAGTGSGPAEAN